MRPTSELPLYVGVEPAPAKPAPTEPRPGASRYVGLPAAASPSLWRLPGWTSVEIIHHVLLEPADAAERFDRWWSRGPRVLRVGRASVHLEEQRPSTTLRLVGGRAHLALPPSIAVELELAGWGRVHTAMYLRPINKFLLSSGHRRRAWFALGHDAVDQVRDALLLTPARS